MKAVKKELFGVHISFESALPGGCMVQMAISEDNPHVVPMVTTRILLF